MLNNLLIAAFMTCFVCANEEGLITFLLIARVTYVLIMDESFQKVKY